MSDTSHTFEARESDWGFTQFLSLSELHDQSKGFILNDSVVLECEVHVRKDQGLYSYDSRKETGFIGENTPLAVCMVPFFEMLSVLVIAIAIAIALTSLHEHL